MKRFVLGSVVLVLAMLTTATASAAGGPFDRVMPRFGGWRSYSYQPAPATAAQPGYRSYSYEPAATYRFQRAAPVGRGYGRSYESVTNKALGRVN